MTVLWRPATLPLRADGRIDCKVNDKTVRLCQPASAAAQPLKKDRVSLRLCVHSPFSGPFCPSEVEVTKPSDGGAGGQELYC